MSLFDPQSSAQPGPQSGPLADLLTPRPIASLDPPQIQLITAVRHWAAAHRQGRWAVGALQQRLGDPRAAAHVQLLLEQVGSAWPEPFCVGPPCCRHLSHDESLVADLLAAARADDRAAFDGQAHEMLAEDSRDRLFLSLRLIADLLRIAEAKRVFGEPGA